MDISSGVAPQVGSRGGIEGVELIIIGAEVHHAIGHCR